MKVGIIVPQGWTGEYDGWDPQVAWQRTVQVARQAEALGFESIWLFDHFHTFPEPTDEITFESFTSLAALAASTSRVRLGHMVACAAFPEPGTRRKDGVDDGCHQRRSDGARDRGRLEAR